MLIEAEHIETVGRYVMRCTGKGHHPEEEQCALQPERCGNGERNTAERRADEQFHADNPPPFGAYDVDEWTPQRLYYPRQIEP